MRKNKLPSYILLGILAVGALALVAYLVGTPGWGADLIQIPKVKR